MRMNLLPKNWFLEKEQTPDDAAPETVGSYSRNLSPKEVVFFSVSTAALGTVSYQLHQYFYPWLGIPVPGLSGFVPFIISAVVVGCLLFQIPFIRRHEIWGIVLTLFLSGGLAVFLLSFYARISG